MSLLSITIFIYAIAGVFFGFDWVVSMFREAGCFGKILASIWVIAFVIGVLKYFF